MANYHLSSIQMRAARPVDLSGLREGLVRLAARLACNLSRRHTRRVLEALPRDMLEDIGVPHTGVSRRAGALDRYPHVIEPRSGL